MRRVLSVLVENEPGVLSRVAGLFSGRGFNIESLNVAPALEDGVSLMTITTSGDEQIIEQIVKQLRKLVTVVKVVDFDGMAYVEREMMVIKVHAEEGSPLPAEQEDLIHRVSECMIRRYEQQLAEFIKNKNKGESKDGQGKEQKTV